MNEQQIQQLHYVVSVESDYLRVRYWGQAATVAIANEWFIRLDRALEQRGLHKILWDSRQAEGHPTDVRDRIWQWLNKAEQVKVSAIIVKSQLLRTSGNLSALGSKLRLRSFHEEDKAAAWLKARTLD